MCLALDDRGARAVVEQPLDFAGFVGLRLYTGPMYVKYNTILRAKSGLVPALAARAEEMCLGNLYPSTLQVRRPWHGRTKPLRESQHSLGRDDSH